MRATRPSAPRRSVLRRTAARRALSVVGTASLVVVPAAAAIAADDAPAEPTPDATQPATPEVVLPSPDQVDQVGPAPEETTPSTAAPAPEPAAPVSAPSAATDDLSAATPPPGSYFGVGKAYITVEPHGTGGSDLTATFLVTADDGETPPTQETITTASDGRYNLPTGYSQDPGDELTITLVDAPAGYMLPANVTQVVPRCVVPVGEPAPPGAACEVSLTFPVVADYRTVAARTRTAGGAAVAGVTVELHSPDVGAPTPTGSPTESPTSEPMPSALPADGAALDGDLAAVTIPGRTLIATGVTDASGRVVFDEPVTPAQGYLLVPTRVPDGYLLPAAVSVDVPAVATVAEADLALDVPITMVPRAVATTTPGATGAAATPPRYTGATLPDTGVDAIALACLAGLFVAAGAASVVGSRRSGTRA